MIPTPLDLVEAIPIDGPDGMLLRLYVAGGAPNSTAALANLQAICDGHPDRRFHVEVVDLLREPRRALVDRVFVTPLLLRVLPEPSCRIVGALTDRGMVCSVLGLTGGES